MNTPLASASLQVRHQLSAGFEVQTRPLTSFLSTCCPPPFRSHFFLLLDLLDLSQSLASLLLQEANVPADEPLLHDTSHPSTLIPTLPPTSIPPTNNYLELLFTFSQFSPGSQKKVQTLINTSLPLATNVISNPIPKLLFSIECEHPFSSTSHAQSFELHPFILNLGHNGVHIPLSLFTTSATNKLHNHATSIKQNIVYNSKSEMDAADWHKAWNQYNPFLHTHADKAQDDFKCNFRTILTFDVEQRTCYSISPEVYNEDVYQ
ncbi:hypothetical protein BKA93DRAFT_817531 [Sparassis latifolia]